MLRDVCSLVIIFSIDLQDVRGVARTLHSLLPFTLTTGNRANFDWK